MSDARSDLLQVFRHRKGKDYHELFTAVAKETSPKLFMALAARFGWHSGTLYRCLFLNVLIKISTSSCLTKKHGMCGRLLRTIYGLKQCGREWFLLLTSFLKIWFKLLCVDHSVFYNGHLLYPCLRGNVASDQETCAHGMGRSLAFRLTGIYKSYAGNDEYYREASKIYLCCDPLGVIPIPWA